jgi:hypothetical protein
MYPSENAANAAEITGLRKPITLWTAFSIPRICANGSREQAQLTGILASLHSLRFNTGMPDSQVDFSAPAVLRKWPSLNGQRVGASLGARPYMIGEGGTLDECIRQFMHLPEAQRDLYEIHTAPQSDVVGTILSTEHIVELARLRDFIGK